MQSQHQAKGKEKINFPFSDLTRDADHDEYTGGKYEMRKLIQTRSAVMGIVRKQTKWILLKWTNCYSLTTEP